MQPAAGARRRLLAVHLRDYLFTARVTPSYGISKARLVKYQVHLLLDRVNLVDFLFKQTVLSCNAFGVLVALLRPSDVIAQIFLVAMTIRMLREFADRYE